MLTAYGISQAGSGHMGKGIPCQDCNAYLNIDDKTVIAAIADGIGWSPVSQHGASTAVQTAMDTMKRMLTENTSVNDLDKLIAILRKAFMASRSAVIKAAQRDGRDAGEYETTLTAVIMSDRFIACGHCGDGGVIQIDSEGNVCRITRQMKGSYEGQVYTLVSHPDHWTFGGRRSTLFGAVMVTDGMLDYFNRIDESQRGKYLFGFFAPCMNASDNGLAVKKAISHHVGSDAVMSQVDDDRTVLMIYNRGCIIPPRVSWITEDILTEIIPIDEGYEDEPLSEAEKTDKPKKSGLLLLLLIIAVILLFTAAVWFFDIFGLRQSVQELFKEWFAHGANTIQE